MLIQASFDGLSATIFLPGEKFEAGTGPAKKSFVRMPV